jgi:hypothetical protein
MRVLQIFKTSARRKNNNIILNFYFNVILHYQNWGGLIFLIYSALARLEGWTRQRENSTVNSMPSEHTST